MSDGVTVVHGDCLDVLRTMPDGSVDAVVTDPPYELGFMGRTWDASGIAYSVELWAECLRVLRPGGHLLAFGGTRTFHRMACAVEDAGFELRDTITWLYGSGFPKSLDVGKAIDKAAGAKREVVGRYVPPNGKAWNLRNDASEPGYKDDLLRRSEHMDVTAPATDAARQWSGWGTALKPASEPIVVARKPLQGTVAANVLAHGTGALNVDACRVGMSDADREFILKTARPNSSGKAHTGDVMNRPAAPTVNVHAAGRWPANVILSHSPSCAERCGDGCPVAELDAQSGTLKTGGPVVKRVRGSDQVYGGAWTEGVTEDRNPGDSGGASRFFPTFRYQAKAPTRERPKVDGVAHPTVKPLTLLRWLVRLVTPPGGTVLDPFAGSGTTGEAAALEGMQATLVEREADYLPLIAARLARLDGDAA